MPEKYMQIRHFYDRRQSLYLWLCSVERRGYASSPAKVRPSLRCYRRRPPILLLCVSCNISDIKTNNLIYRNLLKSFKRFLYLRAMYRSGVYTDKNCDKASINHGVVVVGWGTLNGINYWVVRNSWGATWGQKGYILMQRGVNKCMIETYPAYVIAA